MTPKKSEIFTLKENDLGNSKEDDDEENSSYSVPDAYVRDVNWLSVWDAFA